jgi:hypothetical protein
LTDYQFSGDERLVQNPTETKDPVNMGFLFLFQKLDWSSGLARLQQLQGIPSFFTTQTVVHFCMHANRALPFAPQKFVLKVDDEFIYRDTHAGSSIAMRHYVNPIRHKFWTPMARCFPK